ncbi:hypothetical protein BKA70DRAFT_1332507 [Coprinopsis sp. MPI-PUGE-AT-0042]|nr:hypothetical protein BKA70DRAFT_1332507 [Coprinopsis sp. MPI-PUGE-AT-0042]
MSNRRVFSFTTVKSTAKSLLSWQKRPGNIVYDPIPRLPFKLIFQIVDDYVAPSSDLRTTRALASTCRTLASYCRPLLFSSIHLEYSHKAWHSPPPSTSAFPCQGKPDRFLRLIRRSPGVLEYTQHLSFHFDIPIQMTAFRKAIIRATTARQCNVSIQVLSMTYANLRSLKLSLIWRTVPRSVQEAILRLLLCSDKLDSLELNIMWQIPFNLFACLPPTIKHLTDHVILPPRRGELATDPALPGGQSSPLEKRVVTLDTLTLTRIGSPYILLAILSHRLPISLNSLKHLQIGELGVFQFDATCVRILSLCSKTLECLHIGVSFYISSGSNLTYTVAQAPIPLGELGALRVLEIRTDLSLLKRTLQWLSDSIATIPPEERHNTMQRLKICILFSHTLFCGCLPCLKAARIIPPEGGSVFPDRQYLSAMSTQLGEDFSLIVYPRTNAGSDTAWHRRYWEGIMSRWGESWSNLGLANVTRFLEHMNPVTRCPLITDDPPTAFEHGDEYASLWDGCVCSGWRYWT